MSETEIRSRLEASRSIFECEMLSLLNRKDAQMAALSRTAPPAQPTEEEITTVWKATFKNGDVGHFGAKSVAEANARKTGVVEQVVLRDMRLIPSDVDSPAQPTAQFEDGDISMSLREYASNPGYSHGDYADTMRQAADAIDRLTAQPAAQATECKCSMRTKLVGDGCEVCNPEMAAEIERDNAEQVAEHRQLTIPNKLTAHSNCGELQPSEDDYYSAGHVAGWNECVDAMTATPVVQASTEPFQQRVQPWMLACFGAEISADAQERNHRFLEESLELVQACGATQSEAHQLVDYVYGRPVGEKVQEVGGVMVTLAALCLAQSIDMHAAGEIELARIWTKVEAIRAKQAAKPKHSPLPIASAAPVAQASAEPVYFVRLRSSDDKAWTEQDKAFAQDVSLHYPKAYEVRKLYAAPVASATPVVPEGFEQGVEAAAKWVDQRRFDYESEHGSIDPDTGALEFGTGKHAQIKEEYAAELAEIAEGIRTIAAAPKETTK